MSTENVLPDGVIVRQRSSGGLVPRERFYADGRVRQPDGRISMLDPDTARLASHFPPAAGSADFVTMELTFATAKGVHRITAADSNPSVPEALWEFWDDCQEAARSSLMR